MDRFPLLTAACKGRINPDTLSPLLDLREWLRDDLRQELDAFMGMAREFFAPVDHREEK